MRNIWISRNLPKGNQRCMSSPTIRPNPEPILKTGMKIPLGAGTVLEIIDVQNCKRKILTDSEKVHTNKLLLCHYNYSVAYIEYNEKD